jgi:DNA polymerase III subunit beta
MSLSIIKEDLFDVVQKAFPLIPQKNSLQILSNFKMSFVEGILEISATDLDHFIRVTTAATGDESFEISVSGRKFFEIVRELPNSSVYLELRDNVVNIKSETGFSCKIAGAGVHEYPGFPDIEKVAKFTVSSSILRELIVKGSFAAAKDESRAILSGVFIEVEEKKISMVSTDGHRLGYSVVEGQFSESGSASCVVAPKSLHNLLRVLDAKEEEMVTVEVGEKYIVFSTPSMKMYSKLLIGSYPEYSKVIPLNNPKSAVIERNALQIAVKRVAVLSNQKTHLVKFTFSENNCEIVVSNHEIGGEAQENIPIEYSGDIHSIGFNSHYLLEILDIIATEKIKIEMNTQISACLLFPCHKEDAVISSKDLFLIMPLRVHEEG